MMLLSVLDASTAHLWAGGRRGVGVGGLSQERKVLTIMRICKRPGREVAISNPSTKETREFLGLVDASLVR